MRPDQIERLKDLQERLCEVVLVDADPINWTGNGRPPMDLDRDERGDAYWCRKMAVSSLAVFSRVSEVVAMTQADRPPGENGEDHLDQHIARAEKEAARLLDEMQKRGSRKTDFAKRVHGRP